MEEPDAMTQGAPARVTPKLTISARWDAVGGRPSGFDYMRIGLATAVLVWHSYGISYGMVAGELFFRTPMGLLLQAILPMFFCLSGFLVTGSLERNRDLRKFLTLRVIRIFPALCIEVIASALILGPIVTTFSLSDYFIGRKFFSYFLNVIGWIHYILPGVFTHNPLKNYVNVSIWTVPFELECYIVLPILVLLGFMKSRLLTLAMFIVCTIIIAILLYVQQQSPAGGAGANGRVLVLCFLAGTVVFRFRDILPYNGVLAVVSIAIALPLLQSDHLIYFAPPFVAYATAYLGLLNPARSVIVNSGDYSYGLYLYAAPIQQTVAWALGSSNTYLVNVAIALPVTIVFALFSWHFVEKPFQKVKTLIIRSRPHASTSVPEIRPETAVH